MEMVVYFEIYCSFNFFVTISAELKYFIFEIFFVVSENL